jgi:hypothetical protein
MPDPTGSRRKNQYPLRPESPACGVSKGDNNMSGVNQITIVGNVGSAPELSYGQNNVPFCRFSVAVNEHWKTDGEKRERVTWFPV